MTAMCPEGFVGREYHEDRVAELEREIQERANKALVDAAHKAQLIYWLLCVVTENKREWGDAALCLTGLGYAPDGDRAKRMLERGEPSPRQLDEAEEPESPLPTPHRINSVQDFVDLCGESDPLFAVVSRWFAGGGRGLEVHALCPECNRRPPLCKCGQYERGCS